VILSKKGKKKRVREKERKRRRGGVGKVSKGGGRLSLVRKRRDSNSFARDETVEKGTKDLRSEGKGVKKKKRETEKGGGTKKRSDKGTRNKMGLYKKVLRLSHARRVIQGWGESTSCLERREQGVRPVILDSA